MADAPIVTVLTDVQVKAYTDSIKEAIAAGVGLDIETQWRYRRHGAVEAGAWTVLRGAVWPGLDDGEILCSFTEGQDPNTPTKKTLTFFPQPRVEYGMVRLTPGATARMRCKTVDEPSIKKARSEVTAQVTAMSALTTAFAAMSDNLKGEVEKTPIAPSLKVPAVIGESFAVLYPHLWLARHESWKQAVSDWLMWLYVHIRELT